MPLWLGNDDVENLLDMREAIRSLESAYAGLGRGRGVERPRSHTHLQAERGLFRFKSQEGGLVDANRYALRVTADVLRFHDDDGTQRRTKIPSPDGFYTGLIFLFRIDTGELEAVLHDAFLQRMRVGATNGLAADKLAIQNAHTVGLLGSGWQAGAQLKGLCAVRPIREVRVYSPNPESRSRFAEEMDRRLAPVRVEPVDTPTEAARGADILVAATNSLETVINHTFISPGMHVSAIQAWEISPQVLEASGAVIVNVGGAVGRGLEHGGPDTARHFYGAGTHREIIERLAASPDLAQLVVGDAPGRRAPEDVTCFVNQMSLGIQFAAIAGHVVDEARARGLGKLLPRELFAETLKP